MLILITNSGKTFEVHPKIRVLMNAAMLKQIYIYSKDITCGVITNTPTT